MWAAAITKFEWPVTAVAMLVGPETSEHADTFPAVIDRLLIPFRVFTAESEALAFLGAYVGPAPGA